MSDVAVASRIDEFVAAVRSVVEPEHIYESRLGRFEVDGMLPDVALAPRTVEELVACLSEAHETGLSIIPFGGGTHIGAGNVPESYDVAVSVERINRIAAYEPADLTITAGGGLRLQDLQAVLGARGQFLPLDPPSGGGATIGGVLAANAYGPRRHAFGTARDWLIGSRVVHADGTVSKGGGRVVKNVAGYDMPKLYVGSFGTLGVIAEATFKVAPLPKLEATVVVACDSAHAACTLLFAAHDAGLALHAAELLSPPATSAVLGEHRWMILARAAGGAGAIDRSLRELHEMAAGLQAAFEIRDSAQTWRSWNDAFKPGALSLRVIVMPSSVADAIEVLDRRLVGSAPLLSATVSAGVIRAQLEPTREARAGVLIERTREVAERYDGTVVVDAASPAVKRLIDVFGPLRPDFAIMKRLKQEFDPARRLAPGRFVGRL